MTYEYITTREAVGAYDASSGVFHGLLAEMRELSKKKPEATLSKNKVRILNRVLDDIHEFLGKEPEAKYLDQLDDEELPQNSDAVLTMVQYEKALHAFSARYRRWVDDDHYWITREQLREWGEI